MLAVALNPGCLPKMMPCVTAHNACKHLSLRFFLYQLYMFPLTEKKAHYRTYVHCCKTVKFNSKQITYLAID